MVEMRSRLAYRKSESGNPPPTAGAPELYPNRRHGGTVNPPCNRKSGNGNPPPKAGRALLLSQRDDGLRPQDDEGLGPAGPNLPQGGPEQPVEGGQRWSRPFALEHSYLLSKGEDFESGVYATFKEYADGSQDVFVLRSASGAKSMAFSCLPWPAHKLMGVTSTDGAEHLLNAVPGERNCCGRRWGSAGNLQGAGLRSHSHGSKADTHQSRLPGSENGGQRSC